MRPISYLIVKSRGNKEYWRALSVQPYEDGSILNQDKDGTEGMRDIAHYCTKQHSQHLGTGMAEYRVTSNAKRILDLEGS
jgi:hypothetical protein